MSGFQIKNEALVNEQFRHILYTDRNVQITVMSLELGGEIGAEIHDASQILTVHQGQIVVTTYDEYDQVTQSTTVDTDQLIIIKAGTKHHVRTQFGAKLSSVYSPPVHGQSCHQPPSHPSSSSSRPSVARQPASRLVNPPL